MRYHRLTFTQRLSIEQSLKSGLNQSAIARRLGVHRSTVCNEIRRNSRIDGYSARYAEALSAKRKPRTVGHATHTCVRAGAPVSTSRATKHVLPDRKPDHRAHRSYFFRQRWYGLESRSKRWDFKKEIFSQPIRRMRDYWLEGILRCPRYLHDWLRYAQTGKKRPAFLLKRYKRTVEFDRRGIIRGTYQKGSRLSRYLRLWRLAYKPAELSASGLHLHKRYCDRANTKSTVPVGQAKRYPNRSIFHLAVTSDRSRSLSLCQPALFTEFLLKNPLCSLAEWLFLSPCPKLHS